MCRMTTLIIATRNAHKVSEIRDILGSAFRILPLRDFPDAPLVEEDASTFAGNAVKKAVTLARWLAARVPPAAAEPLYVLADDSGLEVDVLDGAPGVHSARFAALESAGTGNSADADNNAKLLRLLDAVPDAERTARFRCVIAVAPCTLTPAEGLNGPQVFEGTCEGRLTRAPRGTGGFGYDPLFVPDGYSLTFAELGEDTKNRLSHRARALQDFRCRFRT